MAPVFYLTLADQAGQRGGDFLARFLFVLGQVGREGVELAVARVVRIVEIQRRINPGFPGIDAGPVGAVVIRLQPLAGGQLRVGHDEFQFQPALVLVLNPEDAVLVAIEARQQCLLEAVHNFIFLFCRQVGLLERQHAGRVFFGIRTGVDQFDHFFRITAQQLGLVARAVFA